MAKMDPTGNEDNVALHDRLLEEWWDPNGHMRILHKLNILRVPFILEGLGLNQDNQELKGFKILDVACGGGFLSEALAALGAEVTGIDGSDQAIEVAKSHADRELQVQGNKPRYICTTMEQHAPCEAGQYDVVVVSHILEQVLNHDLLLKTCVQALRPGGHLFITSPNRCLSTWWYDIVWLQYVLGELQRGCGPVEYKLLISPESTTNILRKYKCTTVKVNGMAYSHRRKSWAWSSNNWYALQARKDL